MERFWYGRYEVRGKREKIWGNWGKMVQDGLVVQLRCVCLGREDPDIVPLS